MAGAGACSAWDVVEILRKRRADIEELEVEVEGEQAAEPPWQYERIALHFRIGGAELKPAVVARVVRLSVARYCSVIATLSGVALVEATVEVIAPDGTSTGRRHIELALPAARIAVTEVAVDPAAEAAAELGAIGVAEPVADES